MNRSDEHDCLASGNGLPGDLYRNLEIALPSTDDPLGRHATKLMALHPDIIDFRQKEMTKMDDDTKRLLIEDMYTILGIQPPRAS